MAKKLADANWEESHWQRCSESIFNIFTEAFGKLKKSSLSSSDNLPMLKVVTAAGKTIFPAWMEAVGMLHEAEDVTHRSLL